MQINPAVEQSKIIR